MINLLTEIAATGVQLHQTTNEVAAAGVQVHQATNFLDWAKTMSDSIKVTILAVFNVIVLGAFVYLVLKGGFTLAKAFGGGLVCALILWFGNTGILWLSGGIGATVGG